MERRQKKRINVECPVEIRFIIESTASASHSIEAMTLNVSESGVRIRTLRPLDSALVNFLQQGLNFARLRMQLPYMSEALECHTRLIWVEQKELATWIGFQFENPKEETQVRLKYVLERLIAESSVDSVT